MNIAPRIQERLAQAGVKWVRLRVEEYLRRADLEREGLIAVVGYKGRDWVEQPREEALAWLVSGGMDKPEANQLFDNVLYYAERERTPEG